jgi:hypothetical protein
MPLETARKHQSMINDLTNRIRGLFLSSPATDVALAPDPEWDQLIAWALAQPADDSAVSLVPAPREGGADTADGAQDDAEQDDTEWEWAVARAKALALAAAAPSAEAPRAVVVQVNEKAETAWAEGLAQARARRLAEDAEWSACLERAKASRQREADAASDRDEDAEWQASLARAKGQGSRSDDADKADDEAEWLACLARAKAAVSHHAG